MPRGCHWIKRAPKDPYMRTVLATELLPTRHGGQLILRRLECGHNQYGSTRTGAPDITKTAVRCRTCLANDMAEHAAKTRRPSAGERLIDDYTNGRASGGVLDVARRAIALETTP